MSASRKNSRRFVAFGVLLTAVWTGPLPGGLQLVDVTEQTGIQFQHTNGASGHFHIVETVSAGLALFDYDQDGDIDIYFLNGAFHDSSPSGPPPCNALYRNDGNWVFTDVTKTSGAGDQGYGLGVAVGDYDNDGHPDLYLNNYGPNRLYRNQGDGTFQDVTEQAGLDPDAHMGAGANFLDIDGDGDLDLYVSHYVKCLRDLPTPATRGGFPSYLGPAVDIYANTTDRLYRNNGDGTFTDVSQASNIARFTGAGMGTVCGDVDNDGDTDIITANDMCGNFLLANNGLGLFEEVGLMAGMAFDQHGEEQGSMGAILGDYDNDGWLDLQITSYQEQWATLYHNLGGGTFEDVTTVTGAGAGTYAKVSWGNGLVDFDNDGDRDLFLACGHLQPHIDSFDKRTSYLQTNHLYENQGNSRFVDISSRGGPGMQVKLSSRGAGFDDLDNDGDVDVVILNSRSKPTLLRNDTPCPGHWLQIHLRGKKANRFGVGARVKVVAGDLIQIDEVYSGRGYQSHYGTRLYFGLRDHTRVDRIEVNWLGGGSDTYRNIPADQRILLQEGNSSVIHVPKASS